MLRYSLIDKEERPPVAGTTNGPNANNLENELAYLNEDVFTSPNIAESERKSKIPQPITVHCSGRKHEHSHNCGSWSVVTLDGEGSVLWASDGDFRLDREATPDDAEFQAVKNGIVFAGLEYPDRIAKILTSSTRVVEWVTDESTSQSSEVYREQYEHKASGRYSLDVIPKERNRAAASLERAGTVAVPGGPRK